MKAFVVKAKYVGNDYQPKKPVVTFQIPKNLLSRTPGEGYEAE